MMDDFEGFVLDGLGFLVKSVFEAVYGGGDSSTMGDKVVGPGDFKAAQNSTAGDAVAEVNHVIDHRRIAGGGWIG